MKTNLEYYEHRKDAHRHPKFKLLRSLYGGGDKGWAMEAKFWALNNLIADSENCLLDLTKKRNKAVVAEEIDLSLTELEDFVDKLTDPEVELLFMVEEGIYTTKKVQNIFSRTMVIREKSRISKGYNGKDDFPNGKDDFPHEKNNRVKESKVKEIRVNESKREESKEHEIPSLLFNKKPSLTFYDYEPKDFNNDNELSEKIISLAQKYCGKFSLSPSEQSRFKNLIIKNENILKKDAFRILFDCFEQYPNLKPEQKNLPYLASQIQGKINDAVNLAPILEREKNAKDFKKQEYLETKKFSATNTNMTIDELVESVTLDDFISNAKKCDKNK